MALKHLQLYNTLTKEIDTLKPIHKDAVYMYHCGPTVYEYPHIGNMRPYIFADTLRRACEYLGYSVKQVINLTDVGHLISDGDDGEDKMEKGAQKHGKTARELAEYFTQIFYSDLAKLNIRTGGTLFPKASEHIAEQIALIQKLEIGGFTYKVSDGIYFDASKWSEYGKLGDIDLEGLKTGARVHHTDEKHTPYDFALWKFSPTDGTKRQQEWDSPWGVGFPGWHIECSAMAEKYLGKTFDIHTGGIDHIPIHHNNEIAQSEAANHEPLAHIWMHVAFLNWKDRKMSKSDGSFVTLSDLEKEGISPLGFRYFLLQSKYRQPVFFDMEALKASEVAYKRMQEHLLGMREHLVLADNTDNKNQLEKLTEKFTEYIADDLNTPKVVAQIWSQLSEAELFSSLSVADFDSYIDHINAVLGLDFEKSIMIPAEVQELLNKRQTAKDAKDWVLADSLRDQVESLGYTILDTKEGVRVLKK